MTQDLHWESGQLAWVYALVAAAVCGVVLWSQWKAGVLRRIGDLPLVKRMTADVSTAAQWVRWVLVLVAAALVATSLLRPQYGTREAELANRGIDVAIVLDLSKSMMVQDVAPNRLKAAIVELNDVLDALSGGRVALVPFAGTAYTQTPLTTDFDAVRSYLTDLRVEDMPIGGTRVGLGLRHALTLFDSEEAAKKAAMDPDLKALEQPSSSHYRAIILVTDGEDHDADAVAAAKDAAKKNVSIFTIGIGSQSSSAKVPVVSSEGERLGWVYDKDGAPIFSELNVGLLKEIADAATGASFIYGRDDVAAGLVKALDGLEKKEYEHHYENLHEDRFQFVLVPALLLLVAETLLTDRRRRRRLA